MSDNTKPPKITKICGTCQHWARTAPTADTLGNRAQGECRAVPPQAKIVGIVGNGGMVCFYPCLLVNFPACGLHNPVAGSVVVEDDRGELLVDRNGAANGSTH